MILETGGWTVYDALADPALGRELLHRMRAEGQLSVEEGTLAFHWADSAAAGLGGTVDVRPVGVEQSNSSVVFGDELILKSFRRVEPGINPELELLRFLSERGFPNIAPLAGWYEWEGRLLDATLGILQQYLAGARDGWELALDELASDPEAFLERVRSLGEVTGELHTALGSEASDPAFSPDEPSVEALSLLTATVDEQIERVFVELPESEAVAPIVGRGQDVRERLQFLSYIGAGGKVIRTHGDYHLGQTMLTDRGWVILDFEGEPARPLPERRLKRSPLRDVAGMLRSFSYAAAGSEILRGRPAPADWEERAREAFLAGYHAPRRPVAAAARARRRPSGCCRCSSSRRPSTSCATSSTTGPTGCRSRWPGSPACSTRHSRTSGYDTCDERRRPPPRARARAAARATSARTPTTAASSCAPSARPPLAVTVVPEGGKPIALELGAPRRRVRGPRSRAPRCRCATATRSTTARRARSRSRTRIASCPPSASWTCTSPARAATRSCGSASART